ncbi:hypothetical protein GTA08_BOTSDO12301 [Botryosphaeria dothidea]|uniref:Uncharacterized protein n=1 Tax=Botryosphaeria dothidea TaxID=55169 RepID=A0A8H4J3B8_9PEZI|nr:hypothetical protein GTA08_BOTSDO12301 [Botryosphaeria dothidea]
MSESRASASAPSRVESQPAPIGRRAKDQRAAAVDEVGLAQASSCQTPVRQFPNTPSPLSPPQAAKRPSSLSTRAPQAASPPPPEPRRPPPPSQATQAPHPRAGPNQIARELSTVRPLLRHLPRSIEHIAAFDRSATTPMWTRQPAHVDTPSR